MEAVIDQVNARPIERELAEARERLDAYLRAAQLSDTEREELAAMIIACVEERSPDQIAEPASAMIEEAQRVLQARMSAPEASGLILNTQRPPETYPMTMQTSLTRLPSFRMIGGWFLIIAAIVLAFIFTR